MLKACLHYGCLLFNLVMSSLVLSFKNDNVIMTDKKTFKFHMVTSFIDSLQ